MSGVKQALAVEPTAPDHLPVILLVGPRDYSVLAYDRDEDGEPVKEKIKAASTAGVLARNVPPLRRGR